MNKFPISGYPDSPDEDRPGSIRIAQNVIFPRPGVMKRRAAYMSLSLATAAKFGTLWVGELGGKAVAVCKQAAGSLSVYRDQAVAAVTFPTAVEVALPYGSPYLIGLNTPLDVIRTQEGTGLQIPGCPPVETVSNNALAQPEDLVEAGVPRPGDITAGPIYKVTDMVPTNESDNSIGLLAGERCAYRATLSVLRVVDTAAMQSSVESESAPSGRTVFSRSVNDTDPTDRKFPDITVRLPPSLGTRYPTTKFQMWVNLYRSYRLDKSAVAAFGQQGSIDSTPGDEMALVYRRTITAGEMTAGYVTFKDLAPWGMTGRPLYTNAGAGSGITTERTQPPRASSITVFKEHAYYANTDDRFITSVFNVINVPYVYNVTNYLTAPNRVQITLPTLAGAAAVLTYTNGDKVSTRTAAGVVQNFTINGVITLAAGVLTIPVTEAPTTPGAATDVAIIGYLKYTKTDMLNAATTRKMDLVWSDGAFATTANQIRVTTKLAEATARASSAMDLVQEFASNICAGINATAIASSDYVVASNLGSPSGTMEAALIAVELDNALGVSALTSKTWKSFLISAETSTDFRTMNVRIAGELQSWPDRRGDRVRVSADGIYNNTVPAHTFFIGDASKDIIRQIATRDAIYVFKEDGLWTIDGHDPQTAAVTLVSQGIRLLSPNSVCVYQDTVYAATGQGVLAIRGTAVSTISAAIQDDYFRYVSSRVLPDMGALISSGLAVNRVDYYAAGASEVEGTVSFSIPVYGSRTAVASPQSGMVRYAIFVFNVATTQWGISIEDYTYQGAIGLIAPVKARPALPLAAEFGLYSSMTNFARSPLVRLQAYNEDAGIEPLMEIDTATEGSPHTALDEWGFVPIPGVDVEYVKLEKDGSAADAIIHDFAAMPGIDLLNLEDVYFLSSAGNLYRAAIMDLGTPGQISLLFYGPTYPQYPTAGPATGEQQAASRGTPAGLGNTDYANTVIPGAGGSNTNGVLYGWLCVPIKSVWRFSPFGDGQTTMNFNQIALLQTNRGSAQSFSLNFWLDDGLSNPFTSPTKYPLNTDMTAANNVVRAQVPLKATRGSRLTVEVTHMAVGEVLSISKVFIDADPIEGEEIAYK